jgi:hypothetical protein
MSKEILTPVGRLVQGNPFKPQTTDAEGRPLVVKSGPNAGQPRQSFFIALAVPKTDPGVNAIIQSILDESKVAFPQYFDATGRLIKPDFATKFTDGDSQLPNANGLRPCDREGWKGCWVFKFNNGFAPKCFTKGGASIITNSEEIKCGYYVRVYASVAGNNSVQQPGVYLNFSMVELVGYGEEIKFGPTGDIFGASPAALPAGASTVPLPPVIPLARNLSPASMPLLGDKVQPAPDFLNPKPGLQNVPVILPPPPPVIPAAPAPAEKYAVNGVVYTREQLILSKWSNEQISALPRV